jgi:subtilisin family serine protease
MSRFLTCMCLILSLTGCPKGGRPERHFFNRTPQSVKAKIHECKRTTVIAVLDTGFDGAAVWDGGGYHTPKLCQFGHKDFTGGKTAKSTYTQDEVPVDDHGHGTHIAGLIDRYARQTNQSYCLVILKYYEPNADRKNLQNTIEAINYARQIRADFINYSGGGVQTSPQEIEAVKAFINAGGTFVAAAGNEGSNMDFFHYYPAQDDDRVVAVANGVNEPHRAHTSNYGKRVNRWEQGSNILSILPGGQFGYMTGTSQSAAIATGKIVAEKNKSCK